MRLEINDNRSITLFLSDTELVERGFDIDHQERNIALINALVDEALLFAEATHDLVFMDEPFRTEVAYVPSQGAYITISFREMREEKAKETYRTVSNRERFSYRFSDLEDLIACAHKVPEAARSLGQLYAYEGKYLLFVELSAELADEVELVRSILGEYGVKREDVTLDLVQEYGKVIFAERALQEVASRFTR